MKIIKSVTSLFISAICLGALVAPLVSAQSQIIDRHSNEVVTQLRQVEVVHRNGSYVNPYSNDYYRSGYYAYPRYEHSHGYKHSYVYKHNYRSKQHHGYNRSIKSNRSHLPAS